jgi:hypothetical protein
MVEPIDPGDELIKRLLRYELETFAAKLKRSAGVNLRSEIAPLSDGEAAELLNVAEQYSRQEADGARMRCLLISGLMWEHRRDTWLALPGFVMNLLSRIGLDPALPMVDREYDKEVGKLAAVGVPHIEASIAARALLHEVAVGGDRLVLSEFQLRVWRGIDRHERLGISAPTSAGKSHVLAFKVVELLERGPGEILFIVPTLSLINQVTRDVRIAAGKLGLLDLVILQTVPQERIRDGRVVYVLTQERAQSALRDPEALRGLKLLVVDEIQNIERVAEKDDDRSRALYDVIHEFEVERAAERIVISGPRIGNMRDLVRGLFGARGESITAELPPVVNITYSFGKKKRRMVLRQHTPIPELSLEMDFGKSSDYPATAFGKHQYTKGVNDVIAATARGVEGDGGVLVFSPTAHQATQTALHLAGELTADGSGVAARLLASYAAETVHPSYALGETAKRGVLYHHGRVPPHIRGAVEIAFSRQHVAVLVCTTTLMQGVNLPAKTIIALNPRLYTRGKKSTNADLTTYEFANLRGRAGRLLKDFVGRSIALDQSSFEELKVEFSFPEKQLRSGLGDRFLIGREEVGGALRVSAAPRTDVAISDIVVYIRQSVLRFGEQARARLHRVGIALSDEEYEATRESLRALTVPTEICLNCPYWDPFELEKVYAAVEDRQIPNIPEAPFNANFVERMVSIVQAMGQVTPYYYEKHLGHLRSTLLRSLMISAQQWCQERELRDIIGWGHDLTTEDIDIRIERVMRDVAISVPKLLRPVANIQAVRGIETGVLGMMELGAHKKLTQRLLELGLARDVAIRLGRVLNVARADEPDDEKALRNAAVRACKDLNYWDKVQVLNVLAPGQG